MKSYVILVLVPLVLIISAQQAHAATITWDGKGDGVHWSDPNNWSLNKLPSTTDDIVIDSNSSISSNVHLNVNVLVQGTLVIQSGDALTIDPSNAIVNNGTIINAGTISNLGTIKDLCGALFNNGGTITGNAITNACIMYDPTATSGLAVYSGRPVIAEFVSPNSVLINKTIDTMQILLKKNGSPTGNVTMGIFRDDRHIKIPMNDSIQSSGRSVASVRPIEAEFLSSTSALVGKQIDTMQLVFKRVGNPTGNATVGIFNGTILKKSFGSVDASTLGTAYANKIFSLSAGQVYTLVKNDTIGIRYTGGDASSNYIAVMIDVNGTFDGTNTYNTYYTTSWIKNSASDLAMVLSEHTGSPFTLYKQLGSINSALLATRYTQATFSIEPNSYNIQSGDYIGVEFSGGNSSSTNIGIMTNQNSAYPFDGTNTYQRFYTSSWHNNPTFDLTMNLINRHSEITGSATKCTSLTTCHFVLQSTNGNGWVSTSAFVGGYVGQSPLPFSGTASYLLPGETNTTYNVFYSGQAVLAGFSSTAGTIYHIQGKISGTDVNSGMLVSGSTDAFVGIKGHSGRGGGNTYALVGGSVAMVQLTTRTSLTSITCSPSSISAGGSTTCTVSVNDPGAGTASTPTGKVTLDQSPSDAGTFNPASSCNLVSGTCSVTFTQGDNDYCSDTMTATYGGDSIHLGSTATTRITVTGC